MPNGLTLVAVVTGFALVVIAGAWLGAGTPPGLAGLFPAQGRRDWPTGVQEGDVPHFRIPTAPSPRAELEERIDGIPADRRQWLSPTVRPYRVDTRNAVRPSERRSLS